MTEAERRTLRAAGEIITRELMAGNEVRIPGLGKLYTSRTRVYEGIHPLSDDDCWAGAKLSPRTQVWFRPWGKLKDALNPSAKERREARRAAREARLEGATSEVFKELRELLDRPSIARQILPPIPVEDNTKNFGPSKSGKSTVVASSEGNQRVPEESSMFIGINVYKK